MKIEGKDRGGVRDDTCDHGLSRGWEVKVRKINPVVAFISGVFTF